MAVTTDRELGLFNCFFTLQQLVACSSYLALFAIRHYNVSWFLIEIPACKSFALRNLGNTSELIVKRQLLIYRHFAQLTMAEPLSIIGAVAGCQQIMFRLLTVVKALAMAEKERASMILRLHHQTLLLQWFSEFLTDSESKLGADLRNHFNIIIRHMKLTLDDALIEMEKLSKRKPTRFLWALMGNGLKDSEKELSDWSMRLVIALAFVPMPLKTTFIDKLSDTTGGNSLPPCLLGLIANIRMEKGKIDVPAGSTNQNTTDVLDEPEPWDSIKPEYREQLWVDRIKTRLRSPRGPMTMDEIQLEVGKLFAVLKQADSMSNHILTAKHFLVMDDQDQRFAIASSLPGDTARKQLLSDMLLEPSKHVSVACLPQRHLIAHSKYV